MQTLNIAPGHIGHFAIAHDRQDHVLQRRAVFARGSDLALRFGMLAEKARANSLTVGATFAAALAPAGSLQCATIPNRRFASARAVSGVQGDPWRPMVILPCIALPLPSGLSIGAKDDARHHLGIAKRQVAGYSRQSDMP
jgi:hypothetical protein